MQQSAYICEPLFRPARRLSSQWRHRVIVRHVRVTPVEIKKLRRRTCRIAQTGLPFGSSLINCRSAIPYNHSLWYNHSPSVNRIVDLCSLSRLHLTGRGIGSPRWTQVYPRLQQTTRHTDLCLNDERTSAECGAYGCDSPTASWATASKTIDNALRLPTDASDMHLPIVYTTISVDAARASAWWKRFLTQLQAKSNVSMNDTNSFK